MSILGQIKAAVLPRAREILAKNLGWTEALNNLFGRIGSKEYVKLARASEEIDPITDVDALIRLRASLASGRNRAVYPNRIESVNRIYGIKAAIFGEGAEQTASPAVEHGLFFGDYIYPADTVFTAAPTIVTMSDYRKEIIQRHQDLPVFTVGPYIQYAQPHLDDAELAGLKQSFGRSVLVFPSHTTDDSSIVATPEHRYSWISDLSEEYDTIMVSVFWWDIAGEDAEYLRRQGHRVVSCGLTHDRNFLRRQRTLFRLADAVVSDGIGTHIGYALSEGLPVTLAGSANVELDMRTRGWLRDHLASRNAAVDHITAALLANPGDVAKQVAEIGHYWGIGIVRSEPELSEMLSLSTQIAREAGGRARRYSKVARQMLARSQGNSIGRQSVLFEAI